MSVTGHNHDALGDRPAEERIARRGIPASLPSDPLRCWMITRVRNEIARRGIPAWLSALPTGPADYRQELMFAVMSRMRSCMNWSPFFRATSTLRMP